MTLKEAPAAWKKVKPITIKTGITEELKKLEKYDLDENMAKWIPVLTGLKKVLADALSKKIAKEKKAYDCANLILAEVNFQLNNIPKLRAQVNRILTSLMESGDKMVETPTPQILALIEAQTKAYNHIAIPTPNGHDFHPNNPDYFQIPMRIKMLAAEYAKALTKKDPNTNKLKEEFTKYMASHRLKPI